jgi:hypothetical protein
LNESSEDWLNAAIGASNLSQTKLLVGEIAGACATGERSVALADRSGHESQIMINRATHADALAAAGERGDAQRLFGEAEARQRNLQPGSPTLYSLRGYRFCDFLLANGDFATARVRARQALPRAEQNKDVRCIALDTLTLGRASHGLALAPARTDARAAADFLDQAVNGLRAAGQNDDLPRGLLARAAFLRAVGDFPAAARDLDEVEEIAEPGPMRLFLCDLALERARLALAARRSLRAAERPRRCRPRRSRAPRRPRRRAARGGSPRATRRRAQTRRRLRLPQA